MKIVENNGYVQQLESPPPSPDPRQSSPTEDEVKTTKRRKKLSDKQLAALAKGRARVQENKIKRQQSRQAEARQQQKNTEFINAGLKASREAKDIKKKLKAYEPSVSKEKEIRSKLQKKKQNQMKIKSWQSLREETLEKCESVEDFDELSTHLDTITEEEIIDESLLTNKLNKIFDNYKK